MVTASDLQQTLEQLARRESGRLLGILMRHLRDLDLAEEALQDALMAALETWPRDGLPESPVAWILSTAKRRAIDRIRRREVRKAKAGEVGELLHQPSPVIELDLSRIDDDELRLLFLCCHPALGLEAQVALTLHTVAGLRTEQVAAAFLLPTPSMAQRLTRAKRKIKAAGIPFELPGDRQLADRLAAVGTVVYLIFNEGFSASSGDLPIRSELCAEAIRLGRRLARTFPADAEISGLLSLMLLHDARRPARLDPQGQLVALEDQDRSRWSRGQIAEGLALIQHALRFRRPGPWQIQAAIAAVHAEAPDAASTDWRQIAALYRLLTTYDASAVIRLNHAVALAMAEGPDRGLAAMEDLDEELAGYFLLPAARADLLRRQGHFTQALDWYHRALEQTNNAGFRAFFTRRIAEVEAAEQAAARAATPCVC